MAPHSKQTSFAFWDSAGLFRSITSVCCLLAPCGLIWGAVWIPLSENWGSCSSWVWECCWSPISYTQLAGWTHVFQKEAGLPFCVALIILRGECIYLHLSTTGEQAGSHSCFSMPSQALSCKQLVLCDVTWPRRVLNLQASFCDCVLSSPRWIELLWKLKIWTWFCIYDSSVSAASLCIIALRPLTAGTITLKKKW